jgi:hypothetical protein
VVANSIAANSITANEIAANAITASELAANSVVAGKIAAAAISATEISAGAIQAVHLGANSIAVGTAAIQNGAIVNAMIGDATITSAKIASLSASKILAGTIAVGEYIQSSDFVSGVSGWRWGGNTGEFGAAYVRGQLTATQINGNGLVIRGFGGSVILGAGYGLSGLGVLGAFGGGNLCVNGDFAQSVTSVPTNFGPYNNGGVSLSYSIETGALAGSRAWRIHANAAISNTLGFYFNTAAAAFGGFKANTNYVVSFYAAVSSNPLGLTMQAEWNNVPPTQTWLQNPALTAQYQRYAILINFGGSTIDPNGFFTVASPYTLPLGVELIFSCVQVEQGDAPSGWSAPPVTTANPITAANVSTYIASAAIGNAQIGGTIQSDNYVAGLAGWSIAKSGAAEFNSGTFRGALAAATGTFSGALTAASGTFSGVLTATSVVTTDNLQNNAVTAPTGAYTAAGIGVAPSATVQTVVATYSGAPVQVAAGLVLTYAFTEVDGGTQTGVVTMTLQRDAVTLVSATLTLRDSAALPMSLPPFVDTPPAGDHTYALVVSFSSGAPVQNVSVASRGLVTTEMKR